MDVCVDTCTFPEHMDARCRKDCRCRKGGILAGIRGGFRAVGRIVAGARDCRCRQGLSLSPGILVVARDCRCRKGGILAGVLAVGFSLGFSLSEGILAGVLPVGFSLGFSRSEGILAGVLAVGFSLGFSLSEGILAVVRIVAVARDSRCCKGGILRGILAVLTVVGILAIVRVGFSLSEGILVIA